LINKRKQERQGGSVIRKVGETTKVMRRKAKRMREGKAREKKKEGKPVCFGAHVQRIVQGLGRQG
jgi:hypothetical protein